MENPCKRCTRRGLPIFLTLYAAVPKLTVYGRTPPTGNFGAGVTDKALTESGYVLRGLEPGYVYLLCGSSWRGYLIDAAGYPNYYPDLRLEDMPSAIPKQSLTEQCAKQGKSHTGVEAICIESPELISGPVYIAYSRHKWTRFVRNDIAKNPALHMQRVANLAGGAFPHAEVATVNNLMRWVADFDSTTVAAINRHVAPGSELEDRTGTASGLLRAMLESSGELKVPGIIMALHDPIGITAALNHYRNATAEVVLLLDSSTTQQEREDLVVAKAIEDLKHSIHEGGGDWSKHEKHVDKAKFDAAQEKLKARSALAYQVEKMSIDYVQWKTSEQTRRVFREQFDAEDLLSSFDLESWFALSVIGSGLTKVEQDKVWGRWFDLEPSDPDNALWKAATANDKGLIEYLAKEKIDKVFDAFKGAKDIFKETAWYQHVQSALGAREQRLKQKRDYTLATGKIAQSFAAQLLRLKEVDRKKYLRAASQMITVLMMREDVLVLPGTIRARFSQIVKWHQEAWLEKPSVRAPIRIDASVSQFSPKRVDTGSIANEELRREVQSLHGALVLDFAGKEDAVLSLKNWAAARIVPGQAPDDALRKLAARMKLKSDDLVLSGEFKINPLSESATTIRTAKLDSAFSVGTVFVQLISLVNAADELTAELKKGKGADDLKLQSSIAGIYGAIASIVAAGLEVAAARKIVTASAVTRSAKGLLGTAAGISMAVGLVDCYFLWRRSQKLRDEGDDDAAWFAKRAMVWTGVSAASSGVAAVAGIFLSLTGIGLIALVAIAVVSGLAATYYSWKLGEATDTELEKWLNRCRFGRRTRKDSKSPYSSLEVELLALRSAVYAVVVDLRHIIGSPGVHAAFELMLPVYISSSHVTLEVTGSDSWGGRHKLLEIDLWGIPATQHKRLVAEPVMKSEVRVERNGSTARISGEIAARKPPPHLHKDLRDGREYLASGSVSKDVAGLIFIREMEILIKYSPDRETWPNFCAEAKA